MLASLDPVAIDQACIDLVARSDDPGKEHFYGAREQPQRHSHHRGRGQPWLWHPGIRACGSVSRRAAARPGRVDARNTAAETEIRAHGIAKAPHGAGRLLRVPRPLFAAPCLTRGANADIITLPYRSDGGGKGVPKGFTGIDECQEERDSQRLRRALRNHEFQRHHAERDRQADTFTRTSIYNIFTQKKSIFLALLQLRVRAVAQRPCAPA